MLLKMASEIEVSGPIMHVVNELFGSDQEKVSFAKVGSSTPASASCPPR